MGEDQAPPQAGQVQDQPQPPGELRAARQGRTGPGRQPDAGVLYSGHRVQTGILCMRI